MDFNVKRYFEKKHRFVFEYAGAKVECYSTQSQIAEMLSDPTVKLISINIPKANRKKVR